MNTAHVAIIGNGITGITAALKLRELNESATITVFSDEHELFFSRTALMYVYMRDLRFADTVIHPARFYKEKRIDLVTARVSRIDYTSKAIHTVSGAMISYDYLLLAPGSRPRMPGVSGETLAGVQGLYSAQDLEKLEKQTEKGTHQAVIVGGGLIGVELAEMLRRRKIPVTFLVRDALYAGSTLPREEAMLVTDEIRNHGVDLRLSTVLGAIEGNQNATAVVTAAGERIPCSLVGLTIGVEPRLELVKESAVHCARGILTDACLRTNIAGVYAAGDAAEVTLAGKPPQVQQLWYTGRAQGYIAGQNLAHAISGTEAVPYAPGVFFNSAKFFSLEYQTYGEVPNTASDADSILWQDTKGRKLIRIHFDNKTGEKPVLGFNVLGIRYRQNVCENWIKDKAPLDQVLQELPQANFDPEFYRQFERELKNKKSG